MTKVSRRLLSLVFILLAVAFFALYLRGMDYSQIQSLSIDWSKFTIATLLSLGFRFWGVNVWRSILKDLGSKALPSFAVLSAVYAKAWMGRYIPGTVPYITGKILLATSLGIPKSRLAVASVLEGAAQVVAVTAVSLLLVGFGPRSDVLAPRLRLLLLAGALALMAALQPSVFNRLLRSAFRTLRGVDPAADLGTNRVTVLRTFFLYSLGSFISGTAFFFLTLAIAPTVTWRDYFYLVGTYGLAGVVGMVTPFVPSGLGVRDAAQLVLVSAILPKEVALVLAIVARLWSAFVDILFLITAQTYLALAQVISNSKAA
jgi:glycosyltransferase 2 family protein